MDGESAVGGNPGLRRRPEDYVRRVDESIFVERRSDPIVGGHRKRKVRWRWILLGLAGVLVVGYFALTWSSWMLLARGDMVDIGGRSLFISCEGTGSPTVVIEHGLDTVGNDWEEVQDAVSEHNRVCFYSRAGMGFSTRSGDAVRTAQDAVDDLVLLLAAAEIAEPYVLVGHSFGGFVVRLYFDQHPTNVVGMVLVDTTHEELLERTEANLSTEAWAVMSQQVFDNVENMDLVASTAEMEAAGDLGDLPLIVISAEAEFVNAEDVGLPRDIVDEINNVNNELKPILQGDLATLSTNGELIVAEGAGHFVHLDRPDIVIDAIRSISAG